MRCQGFLDTISFPACEDYYRKFRWFPLGMGSMAFCERVVPVRPMTLLNLLDKINNEVREANSCVLIACHGNSDGLAMPLYPGTLFGANRDNMDLLRQNATAPVGVNQQRWSQLRSLM